MNKRVRIGTNVKLEGTDLDGISHVFEGQSLGTTYFDGTASGVIKFQDLEDLLSDTCFQVIGVDASSGTDVVVIKFQEGDVLGTGTDIVPSSDSSSPPDLVWKRELELNTISMLMRTEVQ